MSRTRCTWTFSCIVLLGFQTHLPAQDAELQGRINEAIDKGVAFLKKSQAADGSWGDFQKNGMTALVAWTLLESGVDVKDEHLAKAVAFLRKAAITDRTNYGASVMILFFDKFNDPADQILIESLGVRVMAAINPYGGWTYYCAGPGDNLSKQLEATAKKLRDDPPKIDPEAPPKLHPLTLAQIEEIKKRPKRNFSPEESVGDNSNTQFAALALWVARRHGLPVDQHLGMVEQRFRASFRSAEGGWPYHVFTDKVGTKPNEPGISATMTCAGLLAYAVGQGTKTAAAKNRKDLLEEADVKAALSFISGFVGVTNPRGNIGGRGAFYYFLFSMERVAVIYDLKMIGETDWYLWGARELVKRQTKEGKWEPTSQQHGLADSCFALLFLKRANVALDLTAGLKGIVKNPTKDPVKVDPKDLFDLPILIPKEEKKRDPKTKEQAPPPRQSSLQRPALDCFSESHVVPCFGRS